MKEIYMVKFDWSTDDCQDVDIFLYDTYAKALKKFKEIIEQEKTPNFSWVADVLDKDNNPDSEYEFDTNLDKADDGDDLWWNIDNYHNFYQHDFLSLKKVEVE